MEKRKTEVKFSFKSNKIKSFILILAGFLLPGIISIIFFIIKTGQFPSPFTSFRRHQIANSYFKHSNIKEDVVMRPLKLHQSSEDFSWIVFQKDSYYNFVFSLNFDFLGLDSESSFEIDYDIQPFDNRVLILEDVELGIFNPIVAYLWPLGKKFDISLNSINSRLFDVYSKDLDADGAQEIIIHWLDYVGGSGGTSYPIILKFSQPKTIIYLALPLVIKDQTTKEYLLIEEQYCEFKIKEKNVKLPCNGIHTDIFWKFVNLDDDLNIELVMAYPQNDWDFHYGPQSWIVAVFELRGGKLILDPNFEIIEFAKKLGFGLPEIHGYFGAPAFGQILWMWLPSWGDLKIAALSKGRKESVAITTLKKKFKAQEVGEK